MFSSNTHQAIVVILNELIILLNNYRKHFEEREQLEAEKTVMDTKWLALVGQLRSSLPSSDVLVESTLAPEKLSAKVIIQIILNSFNI